MDNQTQPLSPALIEEVLAHKPQAAAELVRQLQTPIFNLALRMLGSVADAEDATQEILLLVLEKLHFDSDNSRERELRITIPENMNYNGIFDDLFQSYTKQTRLERVTTTNMGTMYELSYRVELRSLEKEIEFMDELRCRNGNLTIILGLVQREKNEL